MSTELVIPGPDEPIGFPISPLKLAVMHVATFGLYDIFWAWKNFASLSYPSRNGFRRMIFALFLSLSLHGLLKRFKELGAQLGHNVDIRQNALAISFFLLVIISNIILRAKDPALVHFLPGLLVVVPLYLSQSKINELHCALRPNIAVDAKFNVANIIGIVVGGIMWLLILVGSFLPPLPTD